MFGCCYYFMIIIDVKKMVPCWHALHWILIQWKVVIIIFGGWEEVECGLVHSGEGPVNDVEPQLPQRGASALGCGCDSQGDRCKWGLPPQSSEVWMGKDMEQRNAIFHWEPSGKTWLLNQCSYLALKGNHCKSKRT